MIYVHKNIVKKAKRDKKRIELIKNELTDIFNIETIIYEGVYKGKLCGPYGLIIDIVDTLNDYVLWDIIENKEDLTFTDDPYKESSLKALISGNQFIELNCTIDQFQEELTALLDSKQLELKYVLDEQQEFILSQAHNFTNIAYTGSAGSGKTLLLNRIAHDLFNMKTPFLYLTYSSSLKEKFAGFLSDPLKHDDSSLCHLSTFEQLLREKIAPFYKLKSAHYVDFLTCEQFVKTQLTQLQNELKVKTVLSIKEIGRILMTIPTFELDIQDPKKKINAIDTIIEHKLTHLMSADKTSITKDEIKLLCALANKFDIELKKKKLKHWYVFLNDLNKAASKKRYDKNYRYILLDEMQDLGQFEFTLLTKLLGNDTQTNYIVTYDENQRIAYEGSTDKSFSKRIDSLKIKPLSLQYNYRNAQNIKALAEYFITEKKKKTHTEPSNLNANQVKVVINDDTEHLISQLVTKFIPEENLNIGIVAFGQTYTDYYDYFYTPTGKSKYVGIDFYNEEDIKGLEYTNLIILNFFEQCQAQQRISTMALRKWYVAITRACDNLLIHVKNEDEYDYAKQQLKADFFDQDYIARYELFEECLSQFNNDILISLGNEQKNILSQEGYTLLKNFFAKNSLEVFDEAVSIFNQLDMHETLKNLLELEFPTLTKHEDIVALAICKSAIVLKQLTAFEKYFPYVDEDFRWQLLEAIIDAGLDWHHKIETPIKTKKEVHDQLKQRGKQLKIDKNYDEYIKLYYHYDMHRHILHTYEETKAFKLKKETYLMIARTYLKENQGKEAIEIYLAQGEIEEVRRFYSAAGEYEKAFEEIYQLIDKQKIDQYFDMLFDLALKIKGDKVPFLNKLLTFNLTVIQQLKLLYELYVITNDEQYAVQAMHVAELHHREDFILRFYTRNKSLVKQFPSMITALTNAERFREVANIYREQRDDRRALQAYVAAYRKKTLHVEHEIMLIVEDIIEGYIEGDFKEILHTLLPDITKIATGSKEYMTLVINTLLYLDLTDKAIQLAYAHELYKKVIAIAENHKAITDQSLVAKAYEQLEKFDEAAHIHKSEGRIHHAVALVKDENLKISWLSQQFDEICEELLVNITDFKQSRQSILADLLQKDFAYQSSATFKNFMLYCENTLASWIKLMSGHMSPQHYLLEDTPAAVSYVINYFIEHDLEAAIIAYYEQQRTLCNKDRSLMEKILQAVLNKNEDHLILQAREDLLVLQLDDLQSTGSVDDSLWSNFSAVMAIMPFKNKTAFLKRFKTVAKHQSNMPLSLELKFARYICLIEYSELPKKQEVRQLKTYFNNNDIQMFYTFLNELTLDFEDLPLNALLNHLASQLAQTMNQLSSKVNQKCIQKDMEITSLKAKQQENENILKEKKIVYTHLENLQQCRHDQDGQAYAALYKETLEEQYTKEIVTEEKNHTDSFEIEMAKKIYKILDTFETDGDTERLRIRTKSTSDKINEKTKKISESIEDTKDRLKNATAEFEAATDEQQTLQTIGLAIRNAYPHFLTNYTKQPSYQLTDKDLQEESRHELFKKCMQTLPIEETPQQSDDEVAAILEDPNTSSPLVENGALEVKQPTPTEDNEKLESAINEVSSNETVIDISLAHKVQALEEVGNILCANAFPPEIITLYLTDREKFKYYQQLVSTLTDEQIEVLSHIQPLAAEHLHIIKLFQTNN